MELRSCQHLHFIQAIKDGVVIKILNVLHGKPALKFKKVEDIYQTEDSKSCNPPLALRPKVEFEALPIGCKRTKGKSPCMVAEEEAAPIAGTKISEFHFNWDGVGVEGELDDLKLDAMTLKQIKEIFKANKKKRARYVGSSSENVNIDTFVKGDHSSSQSNEDDYEDMECLSHWKSIYLKNKAKRNCRKINASISSRSAQPVVKSEEVPMDQAVFVHSGNLPAPVDIKVQVLDLGYSDCQSKVKIESDSTNGCDNTINFSSTVYGEGPTINYHCALDTATSMMSCEEPMIANESTSKADRLVISNEEVEAVRDCRFEIRMSPFFTNEPQCCVLNEQSCEYVEQADRTCIVDAAEGNIYDDGADEISPQSAALSSTEFAAELCVVDAYSNDKCMETTNCRETSASNDPQCSVAIGESYENVEHSHSRASVVETMTMDTAEVSSDKSLASSFLEINEEGSNMELHPDDNCPVLVSPPKNHSHEMYDSSQSFPCMKEKVWNPSSKCQDQAHDIATVNSLPCLEVAPSNSSDSHLSKDGTKDSKPLYEGSAISNPFSESVRLGNSDLWSISDDNFVAIADNSHPVQERQCLLSACADAAPYKNEPVESVEVKSHHHFKTQYPPERLFSFRKVISPTSQKRLCEAMESSQLDDEEFYRHTRKLCYMKLTESSSSRLEEANQVKRSLASITPKQAIKTSNGGNNGFSIKRTLRGTHLSRPLPRLTTECNSARSCSESAISFSRKQMRDIESVSTKLANELKSMKDIVEETLHSEVYPATSSKYTADEVRIAIQKATRVEENARKWLSIMARDCNRFCKIMQVTERGSAPSKNAVYREKRKIVFADEAGGRLCDIRTFEKDMASFTEYSGDKLGIVD